MTPADLSLHLVRTLVSPGAPIGELAEHFGMSRSQLADNLRTDTMYRLACGLALPDDVKARVRNPRLFNTSVLERLVQSKKAMEFLGIKFDEHGHVTGRIHEEEFKKAYSRMVSDIALNVIDTRSLNNHKDIERYLGKFGVDAPNKRRRGVFSSEAMLSADGKPDQSAPPPATRRGPAVRRESPYLISSGMRCQLSNPRIVDIFKELKGLRVADYPNAVAVLLRIFLELLVGNYLDKTNKIKPLLERARKKGKRPDYYPTLRHMLTELLSNDADIELSPLARKQLRKMISDDDHPLSLDKMDQFVHNRYTAPTDKDLRKMWDLFQDLIVQLVVEPCPPVKPAKRG